ncbi:MAG: toll/interleukin receptor protein [Prosthecobacter sp.]|nr:toll/interleukin receptor protein [Prosthecobacter sp.]
MANQEHLKILKQGVEVWNVWRKENGASILPDLRGSYLRGVDLRVADFTGVDLRGADLRGAVFIGAHLSGANLSGANLRSAHLSGVNLSDSILCGANFSRADLIEANFSDTNLSGAIFSGADLGGANFNCASLNTANFNTANLKGATFNSAMLLNTVMTNTNLSQTKGLELAKHHGPSSIGIDTLYLSKGQIPEVFLRGCGVPDSFINQAKALIGAEEGIQFYSCFISYSGKDDEFAHRLHARLQQAHIRVWFAPHDMQSGKKLHEQIDEAIKVYDKLLILLSPSSIRSDWVMTELRKARKDERKTGKRKLFPIGLTDHTTLKEWECFDSDTGSDLAVEVREYFIPDFTNWKDHDAFEAAFARLLKDLKGEGRPHVEH